MKIKAILSIFCIRCFACLPLPVSHAVARLLAQFFWLFPNRTKRITQINLKLCFPQLSDKERSVMARKSIAETLKLLSETGALCYWSSAKCLKLIKKVKGIELFHEARQRKKGVLILLPHIGNWELMAPFLSQYCQVTALYKPPKMQALEPVLIAARQRDNIKMVKPNIRGVAELLKALRNGEVVAILPDQEPKISNSGIYSKFFNIPAFTMVLVYRLLQKASPAVFYAYILRNSSDGFVMNFEPASKELFSADIDESVNAMNKDIQNIVLQAPEQYQWEYKRFKKNRLNKKVYSSI